MRSLMPVPAVTGPSQERIEEYRQQLNEQARKLAAEQAQFAQDRQALGANSTAQMPETMPTTAIGAAMSANSPCRNSCACMSLD